MAFSPATASGSSTLENMHMFEWDESSGWISLQSAHGSLMRLCWLPEHLRGHLSATHGMKMTIGGHNGTVTILDLSEAALFHCEMNIIDVADS
jgi:hypothetical protein